MTSTNFVGIDIAKDKFDVAIQLNNQDTHLTFNNDKQGHNKFLKWLNKTTASPWVCMEATGHYGTMLADFLYAKGVKLSVVNPYQIKNFARASLARNKNDIVDARLISQFCERMNPRLYTPISSGQKEIRELIKVMDMLGDQKNRMNQQMSSMQCPSVKTIQQRVVRKLEQEIKKLDKKIKELISEDEIFSEHFKLLTSIQGVGKQTAFRVIGFLPDVSLFHSAKQFAAYIGVTPKQHQSGKMMGKTTLSKMGSPRMRKALYMAALVAKRHNKGLADFVNRLKNKGKKPKSIVGAVMRKLAHLIFVILKNKQPFDANYSVA